MADAYATAMEARAAGFPSEDGHQPGELGWTTRRAWVGRCALGDCVREKGHPGKCVTPELYASLQRPGPLLSHPPGEPGHCHGCDLDQPDVATYEALFTDATGWELVRYCSGCAELAQANWNGCTIAIRPCEEGAHA